MLNLLLIDDDGASHFYHREMMLEAGYDLDCVKFFKGADEALTYLKDLHLQGEASKWPDYMLVDINMPRKNGFDFIGEYKTENFPYKWPTILMVTSSSNPKDIKRVEDTQEIHGIKTKFLEAPFFKELMKTNS